MTSDQLIPRTTDIIDRVLDAKDSAQRLGDKPLIEQLNTLIKRLPAARFRWELGVLIVHSPSGKTYRVSNAGCDCLNGQAGKRECWHWHLHQTLLSVFDTQVEDNDQAADIGALFAERLAVTAQIVAEMRRAQGGRQCSIWV